MSGGSRRSNLSNRTDSDIVYHPFPAQNNEQPRGLDDGLSKYLIKSSSQSVLGADGSVKAAHIGTALKSGFRRLDLLVLSEAEGSGKKQTLVVKPSAAHQGSAKFDKCLKEVAAHAFSNSKCPVILCLTIGTDAAGMEAIADVLQKQLKGLLKSAGSAKPKTFLSPATLREHVLIWADPMYDHKENFDNPAMPASLRKLVSIEALREAHAPMSGKPAPFAAGYSTPSLERFTDAGKVKPRDLLKYTRDTLVCIEQSADIFDSLYHGAQMVSISAEVTGLQRWVHETKFSANGGCGYVQKPTWMIDHGAKLPREFTSNEKKHLRVEVTGLKCGKKGDWQVTAAVPGTRNSADLKTAIFPGCKEVEIVKGKKQTWMLTVETLQLAAIVFTLVDHAAPAGPGAEWWFGVPLSEIADGGGFTLAMKSEEGKKSKNTVKVTLRWS